MKNVNWDNIQIFYNDNHTWKDIIKEFNISSNSIAIAVKKNKLKTRSISESNILANIKNPRKLSEETKKKISDGRKKYLTKLRAEAADLPETPLTLTLQERPLGEILWGSGAVMDIYNRDNATRTGTAERPVYTINESPHWKDNRLHALVNTSGQTVGYVVATKDGADLAVLEVGGLADDCGIGQLIAAIAALAKSNACTRVQVINHSLGHPLMQALHCGNCKLEIEHFRSGGPMGATVNLRQCLGAMQEELSLRCANSAWNDVSTSLSIQGQDETVTLQLSNGQVRVMDEAASANRLICGVLSARLIVGSESPSDLLYQGLKGEGGALALAEVLFPPQCPMLHRLDAF